jgi:aminoglycoside phosphotransferase (APT) family kinase protein
MSATDTDWRVSDADLTPVLTCLLNGHRPGRRVVRLHRRPSEYRSSFRLEEIDVALDDGTRLPLMFKDLGGDALLAAGRAAKPGFLHDPRREIETYRTVLSDPALGTAALYGAVCDPDTGGRHWLFTERVAGVGIDQTGEFGRWLAAARWLARFHAAHPVGVGQPGPHPHLLRHDAEFYRRWVSRAQEFLNGRGAPAAGRARIDRLAADPGRLLDRLLALPACVLHGDFYPANILLSVAGGELRVCPVDWELAGIGPGLWDLAALVAGKWGERERRELALVYYEALPYRNGWPPDRREFLTALDHARLQVAVQWLGWSAHWSPPAVQAHDWLGEAVEVADRLGA